MRLASDIARLVGRQENGERGDLRGSPKTAHGLTVDEAPAHLVERAPGFPRQRRDALTERRRLDRARADRIYPDALSDEIGGDRLRQSDEHGIGRPLDESVELAPASAIC